MHDDQRLPVILLAYANDQIEGPSYLRELKNEILNIREALEKAENERLCKVEILEKATVDSIFSAFQEHRDNLAIFHFAGHANGFQLLLESESGDLKAAYAAGFASFLGQQKALELVFLNGCSTELQVQNLLEANCSAVIATAEPIDDTVAMNFATRFYKGLGTGGSLKKAYNEAVADIKAKTDLKPRALYWGETSEKEFAGRYPWYFHVRPGAESAYHWNLPDAANNPLFGLPQLPENIPLPGCPFLNLDRFRREHAKVFFGRGFQIRELYAAVTTEKNSPIILLSGQSGVGKSSLLEAGLKPRLEKINYEVYCARRDSNKGLLEALNSAFGKNSLLTSDLWKRIEQEINKPIIVILDQVEEVFTNINKDRPNELENFMDGLIELFGNPLQQPQGKIILGFRKEWLLEIKLMLEQRRLAYQEIFINTMDRRGIIEAINGIPRSDNLRDFYKLEVETDLAGEIADDLLADQESPVAPTLQILLTKLWHSSLDKNGKNRKFTRDLYHKLRLKGFLLGDFIDQQISALAKSQSQVVESGLALDFLYHHTNANGTAAELTIQERKGMYSIHSKASDYIIQLWKGNLLTDLRSTDINKKNGTRLAHDTLAPLILERFSKSDAPGQRALRILGNRSRDWTDNRIGPVLDEVDLKVVEKGASGMRAWTEPERQLIALSRTAIRNKKLKANLFLGVVGVLLLLASGLWWDQWRETQKEQRKNIALAQVSKAEDLKDKYPQLALLYSIESLKRPLDADGYRLIESENVLRNLLKSTGGFPLIGHKKNITTMDIDPNGKKLATGSTDKSIRIWNLNQIESDPIVLKLEGSVSKVAFDAHARWLVTMSKESAVVQAWDLDHQPIKSSTLYTLKDINSFDGIEENGNLNFDPYNRWLAMTGFGDNREQISLWNFNNPKIELNLKLPKGQSIHEKLLFDPQGRWISAQDNQREGILYLWDLNDIHSNSVNEPTILCLGSPISTSEFDPIGRWMVISTSNGERHFLDLNSLEDKPKTLPGNEKRSISSIFFHSKGNRMVTHYSNNEITLWDLKLLSRNQLNELKEKQLPLPNKKLKENLYLYNFTFNSQGNILAASTDYHSVILWDLNNLNEEPHELLGHTERINSLSFNSKGDLLASGGEDKTAILWEINYPLHNKSTLQRRTLRGHEGSVKALKFDPSGSRLATFGDDLAVRIWDLDPMNAEPMKFLNTHVNVENENDNISQIKFDVHGNWLATYKNGNNPEIHLWNLNQIKNKPKPLVGPKYFTSQIAFNTKSELLAVGIEDNLINLWELNSPEFKQRKLNTHSIDEVSSLYFNEEGNKLISADKGSNFNSCNLEKSEITPCKLIAAQHLPQKPWNYTSISDSKARLLAIDARDSFKGCGSKVSIFALEDVGFEPIILNETRDSLSKLEFSPKGRWLAAESTEGKLLVWDLKNSQKEIIELGKFSDFNFDPSDRWLAAQNDKFIFLWDLDIITTNSEPKRLNSRHEHNVNIKISFDFHGEWIASSSENLIRLWNIKTINSDPLILNNEKPTTSLAFDPQGRWLASMDIDGTMRLWQLDIKILLERACQIAGRNLTVEESRSHALDIPSQNTCPQFSSNTD